MCRSTTAYFSFLLFGTVAFVHADPLAHNGASQITVPAVPRPAHSPTEYLLTPPVSPGSGPSWRMAQEDILREAVFRYLFKETPKSQKHSTYYISVEKNRDPNSAFLRRFHGSVPPVRELSALPRGSKNWIAYNVSTFDWANDTHVKISAGESHSGMGMGIFLNCVLRKGQWEITQMVLTSA